MLQVLFVVLVSATTTAGAETAVRLHVQNHWPGGFSGQLTIQAPKEIEGWTAHIIFNDPIESLNAGASADVSKVNDREFVLFSKGVNARLQSGRTLDIHVMGASSGHGQPSSCAFLEGLNDDNCAHETMMSAPSNKPSKTVTSLASLPAAPRPFLSVGTSDGGMDQPEHPSMGTKDYAEALRLSLLFYYAQRSGELPDDNPIPWRRDSALGDCVVGGFYDAGDRIKFGFPLASAMTLLLWGANRFKEGYATAGQLWDFYNIARWGLDFMVDSWNPVAQELVIQIGDGDLDHQFWGKTGHVPRPCVKISPDRPGSDVAAEYAAALAAGALVFRDKGDGAYSSQLLETAESVFRFAQKYRGLYTDSPPVTQSWYYRSTGDRDEMCVAGAWLFKATGQMDYLSTAQTEHETSIAKELSWNDKRAACQLLLHETTGVRDYADEFEAFLKGWQPGGFVEYTPCGLAWSDRTYWGSNRHAANVAFAALLAAENGLDPEVNRKWAAEQINYILGDNPHDGGCFSYEIGYGNKYPLRPHHKAASCPAPPEQCTPANLNTEDPSPHTLYGGLVGGPYRTDGYNDTRTDYVHNEVALDYNAGFQSALAALVKLVATGHLPETNNKCPCGY